MIRSLLTLLLTLGFAAAAQAPFQMLTGTVTGIAGNRMTVQIGPKGSLLLYSDNNSKIWRGKNGSSLSLVHVGDEVVIRYRRDPDGRSVILDLTANAVHIWGRILKVGAGEFEVDENYNADPHSAYRRGRRQIAFDADTRFEGSAAEDLRPGRDVDVIGLKEDGTQVQASRITVYGGNAPARMPPGARVIEPNGTVQNHTK